MVIFPAKVLRVVESLLLVCVLNRFLVHVLVSQLYPKQEHKQKDHNKSRCNAQATWCNTCHDMRDVICNAYVCSGKKKDEQGINLANQACRWKDEVISVEIDIKITENGCMVCKWQEKQEWHKSAINSTMLLSTQQETMLQHPTYKQSIWQWSTQDAWQNMNTELRLNHRRAGSNKHGKSAKDISFIDLVKILTCQE